MEAFKRHRVPPPCFLQGRLSRGDLPVLGTLRRSPVTQQLGLLENSGKEAPHPSLCALGKEGPAEESIKAATAMGLPVSDKSKGGHSVGTTTNWAWLNLAWKLCRGRSGRQEGAAWDTGRAPSLKGLCGLPVSGQFKQESQPNLQQAALAVHLLAGVADPAVKGATSSHSITWCSPKQACGCEVHGPPGWLHSLLAAWVASLASLRGGLLESKRPLAETSPGRDSSAHSGPGAPRPPSRPRGLNGDCSS